MVSTTRVAIDHLLLERDAERAAIATAVGDAIAGAGRLVVVEGEAGIGKSSLLRLAAGLAASRGMRVLAAEGSELERQYPYGVVHSLLQPLLRGDVEGRELFAGPASLAAVAVAAPAVGRPPADPVATLHGLHWLVLNLTERGPLAIVIDDAHWADDASLRVANYIANRIDELPVLLVVGMRPTEAASESEAGRLLRHHRTAARLRPARLSEGAVAALLSATGVPDLDLAVARACWEACSGNPFLVVELLREYPQSLIADSALRGTLAADLVPSRVSDAIESRLAHLGHQARAVAEAVAVLGPHARPATAAALSGLAVEEVARLQQVLSEQAVLTDADPIAFTHPIIQGAVYASIPAGARRRRHREAARALAAEGAAIEAVGVQLLSADRTGDAQTVGWLAQAAVAASAQGEHAVAATYLRRALEEPPSRDEQALLLLHLGRTAAAMGSSADAADHFSAALKLLDDVATRTESHIGLGYALIASANWSGAANAFLAGIRELDERGLEKGGEDVASRLDAGFIPAAWVSMSHRQEAERRLAERLRRPMGGQAERELLAWSAFQRGMEVSATAEDLGELVERKVVNAPIEELVTAGQTVELATGVLFQTDRLDREIQLLTHALDAVPRTGMYAKFGTWSYCRAWPHYLTARLSEALADTEAAVRAHEAGWETFFPANAAVQGLALLERGDAAAAEAAVTVDEDRWAGRIDAAVLLPIARGRIQLARGDAGAAVTSLLAAGEAATAIGSRAMGPPDWRSWGAIALLRHGERDEAQRIAAECLEIAREWNAHWPLGVALRVSGLVASGAEGLALLQQAVEHLNRSPATLELVRTMVDLGAALRRAGRITDARAHLTRAMDIAHRCGAAAIRDRARDELVAAGARPRRHVMTGVESLTPAELRTARLSATGLSNREAAQALFVTPKAVEYHLANAYRKLGITARAELAAALEQSPETRQLPSSV